MLFQNPPSTNAPKGESVLGTTWQEYYYAQYDNAVGRIVINPTATQPAWGVVSSVQLPSTIGSENDSKTGLSKWEKGMLWSGFGVSDQWNDQHYFYGYYLSSAALAGIFDRAWEPSINGKPSNLWASPEQMGTAVDQLLMTLANDPDNAALSASLYKVPGYSYQKFAFFDQYGGHPWATGIPPGSTTAPLDPTDPLGYWGAYGTLSNKYNGENENSAFEGAQAWAATILWGAATDRKSVVDLGIYLFSTNLAAVDSYFFDKNYNFVTENHDKSLPPLNRFSWTPVTTIDSANVTKNGDNDGWPANTGYVDANPKAMYVSPAAFGGEVSAGQSLMKKAESTLNNYFYTFPTGSRFIQAYPPTAWTLGMARNSTYSRKWAGTMMQKSWKDARESALYQPAEWLSMSMTTAAMGVPYSPGDEPFPTDAPPLAPYSQRLWSSWVTANSAPGDRATRNPSVLSGTVLTFLTAFETHGTPDWTYVARASDAAGVDDNTSIVFSATFTKPGATGTVDTSFVAFNPGWITRHVAFYRLDANGNRGTTPMDDPSSTTQPKAKMIFAIPPKTLLVEKRSIAIE
jgi:hypothetical protein